MKSKTWIKSENNTKEFLKKYIELIRKHQCMISTDDKTPVRILYRNPLGYFSEPGYIDELIKPHKFDTEEAYKYINDKE